MAHIQVVCFLASYLVAWGLELSRLFGRFSLGRIVSLLFTAAGLVAHTSFLIARSRETNLPPLLSSTQDWLLVLAWLMIVSYLFLTTLDRDLAVGVFLLPIVCVLVSTTYFVSRNPNTRLDALRGWKMLHASLLVLGILGVTVGFVLAMMYLVQQYRLKHRQSLQEGFRIPSLEKLARLNRWSVMISVPLLTLGMGIGVGLGLYSRSNEGADAFHFTDPIVIGSGLVWLGMVALFTWLLTSPRPPGKQVASLTLWAGGFLLVTLLGLQVLTGQKLFRFGSGHAQLEREGAPYSVAQNTLSPRGRGQGEGAAFEIALAEWIADRYPGLPRLRLGMKDRRRAFIPHPSSFSLPDVRQCFPLALRPPVSSALRLRLHNEWMAPCRDIVQRASLTLPSPARGEGVVCEVVREKRRVVRPASLADASGYYKLDARGISFKLQTSLFKLLPRLRLGRPGLFEATLQVALLAMRKVSSGPIVQCFPLILRPPVSSELRCGRQDESTTPCRDLVQRAPLTLPSPARGEGVVCKVVGEKRRVIRPASLADASGYDELDTPLVSFKLQTSPFKLPPPA